MTNLPSPRFTGFIRDVRTPKRDLQQTFSQVYSFFSLHPSQYFPHSQQQQHQQVQLKNNHIFQEVVHHPQLRLIQFIIKQCKKQMKC
jgi:hypothetical protein